MSGNTAVYRMSRNLFLAQRFARHASPLTTIVYTHPSDEGRVGDWRGGLAAPSPVPASSNAACGFPALRFPACFTPRVMGPIVLEQLSAMTREASLGSR